MKIHHDNHYKGYAVNIAHGGVYTPILNKVIELGEQSIQSMREPHAYLISFPFKDGNEISLMMDRIKKRYSRAGKGRKKESTFKPIYIWVREEKYLIEEDEEWDYMDNPLELYEHYHLCLILDGKKARKKSIISIFQQLVDERIINHYYISRNHKKINDFCSLNHEFTDYVFWMSYLAKVDTKNITKHSRCYGNSSLKSRAE